MGNKLRGPWNQWIPGALNRCQVEQLHEQHVIRIVGADRLKVGASAIDLTLSDEAYFMEKGCVKPFIGESYESELKLGKPHEADAGGHFLLDKEHTYVFKLREELDAKRLREIGIHGQATAKSTVGRLDVLARLVVDGMDTYEGFDPKRLSNSGKMYLEITPITFSIKVAAGHSLSQLRLFYGRPEDSQITGEKICATIIRPRDSETEFEGADRGGVLRLNLDADGEFCAFQAKKAEHDPISFDGHSIDPVKYWEPVTQSSVTDKRIQTKKDEFYILRSWERLWVPNGIAIYCKATDETIGEMRIHYAGFAHPGFGQSNPSGNGAPLIFEVRGHQKFANLRHQEKMANLIFYRMSKPDLETTDYDKQELKLSKIFADYPRKPV